MSSFVPDKKFLRGVLLHYYFMKQTAVKTHRILTEVYGDHVITERTCQNWFKRFKSGNFALEDDERSGPPKKFEDAELKALLDQDPSQTQEELAAALGVSQQTISDRLKAMGMVQKVEHVGANKNSCSRGKKRKASDNWPKNEKK